MRLRRQRRRDRPLVVVAEEDQRRLHHRGEVRAFVERALARRAVAEVDDRDRLLALQLLPPREPGGVRHVRRDRDADRRDVVVGRVPPAGGMAAPPVQDRRGRDPAQQSDRALAVAREDPVLVRERVRRAGLHRLVVPEHRVRPDAALPVVDERALVVRPQQHHRAVEVEQLLLAQPFDLAVLVDDAAQLVLAGSDLGHEPKRSCSVQTRTDTAFRSASITTSETSPRSSPSAWSGIGSSQTISSRSRSWPYSIRAAVLHVTREDRRGGVHERAAADANRCNEVEAELELGLRRDRQRDPLRVRVRAIRSR